VLTGLNERLIRVRGYIITQSLSLDLASFAPLRLRSNMACRPQLLLSPHHSASAHRETLDRFSLAVTVF
jgi:hypothetical protein